MRNNLFKIGHVCNIILFIHNIVRLLWTNKLCSYVYSSNVLYFKKSVKLIYGEELTIKYSEISGNFSQKMKYTLTKALSEPPLRTFLEKY